MGYAYRARDDKRIRVIIDTDAACEADDPFAIAQGLLTEKFDTKAIFATHFGREGSVEDSYRVASRIVELVGANVPVLRGVPGELHARRSGKLSNAADFLIHEALTSDDRPLYVLCLGAISNIAEALISSPGIASRMTVVWIGTQALDASVPAVHEFNAGNDVGAANIVMESGTTIWLIPSNVYSSMNVGLSELQLRVRPFGVVGRYLFDQLVAFNATDGAWWTAGESWSLGDCPAIGVAIKPDCGSYHYAPAPLVRKDTTSQYDPSRPVVRIYDSIDSRFVLEDLYAKLQIHAASEIGSACERD